MLEQLSDHDFLDMSRLRGIREAMDKAARCWHVEALDLLLDYYCKSFPDVLRLKGNGEALGKTLILVLCDYDCDDRCRPPVVHSPTDKRLSSIMKSLVEDGVCMNTLDYQGRHPSAFSACLH